MNPGEKCICTEDDWYNAFGERSEALHTGMRLTVADSRRVGGAAFYSFKEAPEANFYLHSGFKPLRSLN